jgi:hypothetical protein
MGVPFVAPSFANMLALSFPSNPTCAGIHFIVICFCGGWYAFQYSHSDLIVSVSFHRLHQYFCWNMKFVAISIAFSSVDEIATSFSILYLSSKPLASQYPPTPHSLPIIEPIHHQRGFLQFDLTQRVLT